MVLFKNIFIAASLVAPITSCSHSEVDHQPLPDKGIYKTSSSSNSRLDSLNDNVSHSRRNAITHAVAKASPAVVGINVTEVRERRVMPWSSPFDDDPFFRQFFGGGSRSQPYTQKYNIQGLGSGFIVSEDGYILTNDHVVSSATKIIVTTVGGKEYDAKIVAADPVADVALLKIDEGGLPYITLGNSDDVVVGEWAIAMGNPFGLFKKNDKPTVTVGVVSNIGVNYGFENGKNFRNMIQTDAAISSGNSGGPLLNANGEVIGMNAIIYSTAQGYSGAGSIGLGFAIPVNKIKQILDDFKKGKRIDHNIGSLGFNAQSLTEFSDEAKEYFNYSKYDGGAVVTSMYRNSVAEKSGLQPGDLITAVDGEKVKTYEDMLSVIADKKVGDIVKLSVVRSEGIIPIEIKLPPSR